MVTVSDYRVVLTESGDSYIRLILTGGLSMVRSSRTGNFYATTRRCSISATFDEQTAESMIGSQIPGNIIRLECDPYTFTTDSGEEIELSHRWIYTDMTDEELAIDDLLKESGKNGATEEVA